MTLHGFYTELQKREREEKEKGVLELVSVEARELRGLQEREREKKRGGARTHVFSSPRLDPVRISTDFDGKERERRKREGVLEPMYLEARDLTRSVLLRTLLEKRERGRKRGGLNPTFFRGP